MSSEKATVKQATEIMVEFAQDLGWSVHTTKGSGNTILQAPPPFRTVQVIIPRPPNVMTRRQLGVAAKRVFKYADPVKRAAAVGGKWNDALSDLAQFLDTADFPKNPEPEPKPEPTKSIDEPTPKKGKSLTVEVEPVTESAPNKKPEVVFAQPWLAARGSNSGGGRRYPSETTIELHWSDGRVTWQCAKPGCDYSSNDRPQSVVTHYARSKDHKAVQPPSLIVRDPNYTEPLTPGAHRAARVAALQARLAAMLSGVDLSTFTPEALARKIAEGLVTDGDEVGHSSEPPTAEQLLEKIRNLVDRGEYFNMRQQLEVMSERYTVLEQELAEQRTIAQRATDRWQALRELVTGEE